MQLLNPWALLGLLSFPVILGLHLHMERNQRLVVSSMFLWAFLEEKFEGEKPKFIQLSWLLLLDLAIAGLLSLAFAHPVVSLPALGGIGVHRVILIDDSTSMLARDATPDRFSMAKEFARSIIDSADNQDEITVITFGGKAEILGSTLQMRDEELTRVVEDLEVLGSGADLRAGLALAQSTAIADLPLAVYALTDAAFQPINTDDFPIDIQWIFIGYDQDNQAVIDPVLDTNQSKTELFFNLVNFGTSQSEREVEIRVNQEAVQQKKYMLPASSVQPQLVSISGEVETVEIHLLGQDALPIDDSAFISNISAPETRVALVTDAPEPLDRALRSVPGVELAVIQPFEYSTNSDYDLVIFRGWLPETWPSGKVLVFDPPSGDPQLLVEGLEPISGLLNVADHQVLKAVDLAGVRWDYAWMFSGESEFDWLLKSGDQPILILLQEGESEVFLFLSPLISGNFTKHPAFPILLSNLVLYSQNYSPKPIYSLGEVFQLSDVLENQIIQIKSPLADQSLAVTSPQTTLDETGFYTLEMTDSNGEKRQFKFGVNAGDFQESNIRPGEWRLQYTQTQPKVLSGLQIIEVDLRPWLLLLVAFLFLLEAWRAWR